jgi:flagellar biosynthesis protein FliQ
MPIKWETLITDGEGKISLHRLRKFLALVAFVFGLAVALLAAVLEVTTNVDIPKEMVLILVSVCIVPITGGQISDAIFGTRLSGKIKEGRAPGRRSSDT